MRIAIQSLGCKTNHYEAQSLAQRFTEAGFEVVPADQEAELYLLNTCTVTHEAGRKSEQMLRRYRRNFPDAKIAVMGCHAQLQDLNELADFVRGVDNRMDVLTWAEHLRDSGLLDNGADWTARETAPVFSKPCGEVSRAKEYESLGILSHSYSTRAEVKIEDGCDLYCAYCAICLARGHVRSRPRAEILAEVNALVDGGVREIVLSGIHLCSFEKEHGRDTMALVELVRELAEIKDLKRIRLGSLEPKSMTNEVLEALAKVDKLCPHFHMSLQSGSTPVLQRMRRQYTAEEYAERCRKIREIWPHSAITTDLMVAFPEETDAEFEESLRFIRDVELSRIHVFRYSPRDKTPAARMPQVDGNFSKERGRIAADVGDELLKNFMEDNLRRKLSFLSEEQHDGDWVGYSENYIRLRLVDDNPQVAALDRGELIPVVGYAIEGDEMLCRIAE